MYINSKTINFLNQHPEFIIGLALVLFIYSRYKMQTINFIKNTKILVQILTCVYLIATGIIGFEYIFREILFAVTWIMFLPLLFGWIFQDVSRLLGKPISPWGQGFKLDDGDYWMNFISYIPFIGLIPLTIRLYQRLGELKNGEEKNRP